MSRQRLHECTGWSFWRCFASIWSMRKDEVFQELLARLTARGIEPLGALERPPILVELRPWAPKVAEKSADDAKADSDVLEAACVAASSSTQAVGQGPS